MYCLKYRRQPALLESGASVHVLFVIMGICNRPYAPCSYMSSYMPSKDMARMCNFCCIDLLPLALIRRMSICLSAFRSAAGYLISSSANCARFFFGPDDEHAPRNCRSRLTPYSCWHLKGLHSSLLRLRDCDSRKNSSLLSGLGEYDRGPLAHSSLFATSRIICYDVKVYTMEGSLMQAFAKSLGVIFASEIGDKTFFIAALLAMRHSRILV
jgi:hypothetical protein